MRKTALIIQHTSETPVGTTEDWLIQSGFHYRISLASEVSDWNLLFSETSSLESANTVVFICGGGMNVDEENKFPWLKSEKDFIRKLIPTDIKMVGLCLGAQLIAEVLGAKVTKSKHWEVGWHSVKINKSLNPFKHSPEHLNVFQYHRYQFENPSGAWRFASNKTCENQGYLWNNQILATQFHPEATQEWIVSCFEESSSNESADENPTGPFVMPKEIVLANMAQQETLKEWYFETLDSFLLK